MRGRAVLLAFQGIAFLIGPGLAAQHHPGGSADADAVHQGGTVLAGVPAGREGSGTSWVPDSSPMAAFHLAAGSWRFMAHGSLFVRYTGQDVGDAGSRGDARWDGPSMVMLGADRPAGSRGHILIRTMLSLDPIIEGGAGYPLLFQSGETWRGSELVDRQHPHDLIGELAVSYSRRIGRAVEGFLYLGYPGEPALGPPAFLHRASAADDPDAPLGHHWQDSTHIAFGVVTAGLRTGDVKVDGSVFTGREPGEDRYAFDRPRFDSWSGRLSWNPAKDWALQVSHGFLRSPEAARPGLDIRRTTASAIHAVGLANGGTVSSALVWGWNSDSEGRDAHAFLLESDLLLGRQALYARAELVQKTGHDLGIEALEDNVFWINAWTLGTARDLSPFDRVGLRLGGQVTVSAVPAALRAEYGRFPVSVSVYLRVSPAAAAPPEAAEAHRH